MSKKSTDNNSMNKDEEKNKLGIFFKFNVLLGFFEANEYRLFTLDVKTNRLYLSPLDNFLPATSSSSLVLATYDDG